ncbi:MAG TPA: M28 family peptidase [Bryobacteraceae bacterium]|nr:M28 family peptidase [Bryobacteraceae bacterium]
MARSLKWCGSSVAADLPRLSRFPSVFWLRTLTMLLLDESTPGNTARTVAELLGIRIRADPEPDRNLLLRSDHFDFTRIGVPAAGLVFGFEKGSREKSIYRGWYSVRYHSPADDLKQRWGPRRRPRNSMSFSRVWSKLSGTRASVRNGKAPANSRLETKAIDTPRKLVTIEKSSLTAPHAQTSKKPPRTRESESHIFVR